MHIISLFLGGSPFSQPLIVLELFFLSPTTPAESKFIRLFPVFHSSLSLLPLNTKRAFQANAKLAFIFLADQNGFSSLFSFWNFTRSLLVSKSIQF